MIIGHHSLFAANAIVLAVMALTFLLAAAERPDERHWLWWGLGNALLAAGTLFHIVSDPALAPLTALTNGVVVAGFGMRWCAARAFGGRSAPLSVALGPALLIGAARLLPAGHGMHDAISVVVDSLVMTIAVATAWEFFRDCRDGLPSRYGLVAAYGVLAAAVVVRLAESLLHGREIAQYFVDDQTLTAHLLVLLFFTVASGTFALSVAYERNARNLRAVAMRDSLTGLLNRRAFDAHLRQLIANPVCGGFAVLVFDIDHFKLVNDRYGHAAGDAALCAFAEICRTAMEKRGAVARIGGEEFAAIVKHVSPAEALEAAEAIRETVKATTLSVGGHSFRLTISAGMCHSESGIRDFDELMRRADSGLYAAKHKGRDRVEPIAGAEDIAGFGDANHSSAILADSPEPSVRVLEERRRAG